MRQNLSISLAEPLAHQLESACRMDGLTRSEVVQRALRDWLFRRELATTRAALVPYAEAAGFVTDEDVFQAVS